MSWFTGGSGQSAARPQRNPVVAKVGLLVERLKNSNSLEEVLESIDQLSDLSSSSTAEVGDGALNILIEQLNGIVVDAEGEVAGQILQGILDIINSVCTVRGNSSEENALRYTDVFLQNLDNVSTVLNLLQRSEMWVKLNGIELLNTLHKNRKGSLEDSILHCNAGMMRLMDVLTGVQMHEKVRNDMLLLLDKLTQGNDRIKEFVAFQEGFERLFQIIDREGLKSVVAIDCLRVVQNILEGSELTKKLFAQTTCINKLGELCSPPSASKPSTQGLPGAPTTSENGPRDVNGDNAGELKRCEMGIVILSTLLQCDVANGGTGEKKLMSPLKAARSFAAIGPEKSKSVVDVRIMRYVDQTKRIKQGLVKSDALLTSLLSLATSKNVPTALNVRGIVELGNLVCASESAQNALGRIEIILPWGPRNIVTRIGGVSIIFSLALNSESKQIRDAAVYAISCFFQGNETGQISIVGHAVTPPPMDISAKHDVPRAPVAGRILVDTLASAVKELLEGAKAEDHVLAQFWQTCRILETLCAGSLACKELLLRVPVKMANDADSEARPLTNFFMRALSKSIGTDDSRISPKLKIYFQVSIFRFMCILLSKCAAAVAAVLGSPSHLKTIFAFLEIGGNGADSVIPRGMAGLMLAVSLEVKSERTPIVAMEGGGESFDSDVMKLIRNGVGLEKFSDLLDTLMASVAMKAAKSDVFATSSASDRSSSSQENSNAWNASSLFDFSFKTFAAATQETARRQLISAFTEPRTPRKNKGKGQGGMAETDVNALAEVLEQYKELIRVQDKDIEKLRKTIRKMKKEQKKEKSDSSATGENLALEGKREKKVGDLGLADVQVHVSFSPGTLPGSNEGGKEALTGDSTDLSLDLQEQLGLKEEQLGLKDAKILELETKLEMAFTSNTIYEKTSKGNQEKEEELAFAAEEILRLHAQVAKLERQLSRASGSGPALEEKSSGQKVKSEYEEMYHELNAEHMDLLVLLANQEIENSALVDQLRNELGEEAVRKARKVAADALATVVATSS